MSTPLSKNLPDDLVAEVLSWLPVKTLLRLRCVCKSWNKLIISDHSFAKLHLHNSALASPQLLLQCEDSNHHPRRGFCVTHLSGSGFGLGLADADADPWISLAHNPCHQLEEMDSFSVVGSCNGLICLEVIPLHSIIQLGWLCFWNPAIGLMSEKLGSYCSSKNYSYYKMNFGYDSSTNTYKVVCFRIDKADRASHVKVFTLGGCNDWKDIPEFPLLPFSYDRSGINDGVHFSGTINWMASRDESAPYYNPLTVTVEQLVILSLDLGTETYTLLSPPNGLDQVPCVVPRVGVLMDCLCFSHESNKSDFVVWQMKKFGDAESWVQFLRISYQDFPRRPLIPFTPFTGLQGRFDAFTDRYQLFYNGDTLVLAISQQAILYNSSTNTVEQPTTTNRKLCWFSALDYVESLVSPY